MSIDSLSDVSSIAIDSWNIRQGYLHYSKGSTLRIRSKSREKFSEWTMTYKHDVKNRVVEIENNIEERDFNDLWSKSTDRLEKRRYLIHRENECLWEVDYFTRGEHVYFCLAECEMAEHDVSPKFFPEFIGKHLILPVPRKQSGKFSSRKLSDLFYAKQIYGKIENKKLSFVS